MKDKELKDLSKREIEIINSLGFSNFAKKCVINFLEVNIKNKSLQELHNQGIARKYLKDILRKLDSKNPLLKKQKTVKKIPNNEIEEMLNLKQ